MIFREHVKVVSLLRTEFHALSFVYKGPMLRIIAFDPIERDVSA